MFSDLTPEECQALFAVAFGFAPLIDRLRINCAEPTLMIYNGLYGLLIRANGQILATKGVKSAVEINAWKVVKLLESYNIAIGDA